MSSPRTRSIKDLGSGNEFYTDHCLCFGLRCAPFVFTQRGDFIARYMARLGVQKVVNYIDDFIICECTFDSCLLGQQTLIRLVRGLGFAVNEKKVIQPTVFVTIQPTVFVTIQPTVFVTIQPTVFVTIQPTVFVTIQPTVFVTIQPTVFVTIQPTVFVTIQPTVFVTLV